jgi:hypothetical protein
MTKPAFDPRATGRAMVRQSHPAEQQNKTAIDLDALCLSPVEWAIRDVPPEDTVLGPFSTTTRIEFSADTGLGKTMLGLARAHAIAIGSDFLHWKSVRQGRIAYIDGEMPPGLIQTRLTLARSWFGLLEPLDRDRFVFLSKADVDEQMWPLDTPEGARWLFDFLEKLGRFDDITFDNRACLTIGDLAGDDASSQALKNLQRQITKMQIGQFWLHHTGHDTSRGDGRKAREWELDAVIIGEKIEDRPDADVAFTMRFSKARRRNEHNRLDFDPIDLQLAHGEWTWRRTDSETTPMPKLGRNQKIVLDAAHKLLAATDRKPPANHPARHATVIDLESLQDQTRKTLVCDAKHFASRFAEALNGLTNARQLCYYDSLVWLPRQA